jgi:hypothetical protein
MKNLREHAAGVLRGKCVSRKKGQHAEPEERGNPCAQASRKCGRNRLLDRRR